MKKKKIKIKYYDKAGLKVAFNFDMALFAKLGKINSDPETILPIREVFASDPFSIVGSGRAGATLSGRNSSIEEYIKESHKYDIKFNLLLNAISMGGKEWDKQVQNQIFCQIDSLVKAGLDCVTSTIPLLTMKLKEWFPQLEVSSSVNNHLDSIEKIRQLIAHTGIDRIMLDHGKSRNFPLIRAISQSFPDHPIVVLVNESCLPDCVLQQHHQEHLCRTSRVGYSNGNDLDLCHVLCAKQKLSDPLYTLKAPWVRPEDIHYLIEAGATYIKLAGRTKSSEWIEAISRAYAIGRCDGNIWKFIEKSGLSSPDWSNTLDKELAPCLYTVDNKQLDGFIEPFVKGTAPCVKDGNGCTSCQWCEKFFSAVSFPANGDQRLVDIDELLTNIKKAA